MHFEAQSHVFIHHFILMNNFYLLIRVISDSLSAIPDVQPTFLSFELIAILWIRKIYSNLFLKSSQYIRLNQMNIRAVWLQHWSGYLSFLSCKHLFGNKRRIIFFQLLLIFSFIYIFWRIWIYIRRSLSIGSIQSRTSWIRLGFLFLLLGMGGFFIFNRILINFTVFIDNYVRRLFLIIIVIAHLISIIVPSILCRLLL